MSASSAYVRADLTQRSLHPAEHESNGRGNQEGEREEKVLGRGSGLTPL